MDPYISGFILWSGFRFIHIIEVKYMLFECIKYFEECRNLWSVWNYARFITQVVFFSWHLQVHEYLIQSKYQARHAYHDPTGNSSPPPQDQRFVIKSMFREVIGRLFLGWSWDEADRAIVILTKVCPC